MTFALAGIIPALAGNTMNNGARRAITTDHPRSRGEYPNGRKIVFADSGSSPLSRGIPHARLCGGHHLRIIPALAGNTVNECKRLKHLPDHPRSRGEYSYSVPLMNCPNGSSPLSRGIRAATHRCPG